MITSEAAPSYLRPGGTGTVIAGAVNQGDGEVNTGKGEVTITDRLPAGLAAVEVKGSVTQGGTGVRPVPTCSGPGEVVSCSYTGTLAPYERFQIEIKVNVESPASTSLPNDVTVEGGGAPSATASQALTVSSEALTLALQHYELLPLNEDGAPDLQAGSHPFQLTTNLAFSQTVNRQPVAQPKNLRFVLPPGLIGDPSATEQCTMVNFIALVREANLCAAASAIGVVVATVNEPHEVGLVTKLVPVFNLVPAAGEPARFGFVVAKVPIVLDTSVRTGGGYNVVASVSDLSQAAGVLSSQVTLWGVPGAAVHDQARGWECIAGGFYQNQVERKCPNTAPAQALPFLTLPTSCAADPASEPLVSSVEGDSWIEPSNELTASYEWSGANGEPLGLTGCDQLPFTPTLTVAPEEEHAPVHTGSTPSGLSVSVKVPQETTLAAAGLAEANVRDTTVTLPEGVQLSPSAANGLLACPEKPEGGYEGIGFEGFQSLSPGAPEAATFTPTFRFGEQELEGKRLAPSCPEGSKLGTVRIKTPLLPKDLEGYVYLASPAPNGPQEPSRNPFNSLIALYIVAEDREAGVLVKLAGKGEVNESTGQISTTFANTPQLPFEELQLELFGGSRGSVSTPAVCGDYATEAAFTPWSGTGPVSVLSAAEDFAITGRVLGRQAAAVRSRVRDAEHKHAGGRLYELRPGTLASRRRSAAQHRDDAPTRGRRRAALCRRTVPSGAGGGERMSGGQRSWGSHGGGGSWPGTVCPAWRQGLHHGPVWWRAVRTADRHAGRRGTVQPGYGHRSLEAVYQPRKRVRDDRIRPAAHRASWDPAAAQACVGERQPAKLRVQSDQLRSDARRRHTHRRRRRERRRVLAIAGHRSVRVCRFPLT